MRTPQARILNEDLTSENTEQSSIYNTISRGLLPMVENAMQSVEPHGMMPMRVSRLRIGASGSSTSTLLAALTRRMRALAISLKVPSPPTAITPSTEDRSTCCFLGGRNVVMNYLRRINTAVLLLMVTRPHITLGIHSLLRTPGVWPERL